MSSVTIDPGSLKHLVALQRYTAARDGYGAEQPRTWTSYAAVWARMGAEKGREAVVGDQQRSETTVLFVIRHRTDVLAQDRISYGNQVFDITEALDRTGLGEWLWIRARVGMTEG